MPYHFSRQWLVARARLQTINCYLLLTDYSLLILPLLGTQTSETTLTFNWADDYDRSVDDIDNNHFDSRPVIEPMTSTARLKLHTKPEQDGFQLPKIIFQVIFEEISIALNKLQVIIIIIINNNNNNFSDINVTDIKWKLFRLLTLALIFTLFWCDCVNINVVVVVVVVDVVVDNNRIEIIAMQLCSTKPSWSSWTPLKGWSCRASTGSTDPTCQKEKMGNYGL